MHANSTVDVVGVKPSCSNEGTAGEVCTQCHSLCRGHATCLAENASLGSCIVKGKGSTSSIHRFLYFFSRGKKCEPEWR